MDTSRIVDHSRELADRFGALADPVRLAILEALSGVDRCVCELGPRLGLAQNLLSYHLRVLREAGLVVGRRTGRRIEYEVQADALRALREDLRRLSGEVPA